MEAAVVARVCSFILALLLSGIALAQPVPFSGPNVPTAYDARLFGAKCDGATDDTAAISAMDGQSITRIGIYSTCRLSNNLTLTHPLYIGPQGALSVDVGKTLTISSLQADATTPFPGAGTVTDGSATIRLKAGSLQTTASITLTRSNAVFQVGGVLGPFMFNDTAADTISFQALPGALPSTDTTNMQLYPPSPGQKAYYSATALATGGGEERFFWGTNGHGLDYIVSQVVTGSGLCRTVDWLDGLANAKPAFLVICGDAVNPPTLALGPSGLSQSTPSNGFQSLLKLDGTLNLLVGAGANIGTIAFMTHIASSGSAPAVSACGAGATVSGTDTKGVIAVGTGATTSCHIAFATTYAAIPTVIVTGQGTGSAVLSLSADTTAGFTIAASADVQSAAIHYHVIQ